MKDHSISLFIGCIFAFIACCLFARITGLGAIISEEEIALKKGQPFIVKIPAKLFKYEARSISSGTPILAASVSASGEEITVEGVSDWQTRGWPLMITVYYEKSSKKKEFTEVEFRSEQTYVKLRFALDIQDLNAALMRLLYTGTVDSYETSAEFKALEEKLLPVTFQGTLGQIPHDKQLQLMKDVDYNDRGFGLEEFQGKQYITFSTTDQSFEFNSSKIKQSARIATIIERSLLPALEKIAPIITDANKIYGIKLSERTFYKDFRSERNRMPHEEYLEIYAPYDLVEKFYNREITDEKLVEGIFARVDGKQIEVNLSKAR